MNKTVSIAILAVVSCLSSLVSSHRSLSVLTFLDFSLALLPTRRCGC